MTKTRIPNVLRREGREWVLDNGNRIPVIEGGDPTATLDDNGIVVTTDDPPAPAPAQEVPGRVFTEEEVNAIRSGEKDKLYKEITSHKTRAEELQEQLAAQQAELEERRAAESAALDAAQAERRKQEEEELSAKELFLKREEELRNQFAETEKSWEERFTNLQKEKEAADAILAQERRYQELNTYTQRRLQEEAEFIMPELLDLVTGSDEESIEAAISAAKAKTSAIINSMTQGQAQMRGPRGVPSTGGSPEGPLENSLVQQEMGAVDIANMTMEEYKQHRHQLIPQARF